MATLRSRRMLAVSVAFACLGVCALAEESRTYHSLWSGLFKQASDPSSLSSGSGLHAALSELLSRLTGGGGGSSAGSGGSGGAGSAISSIEAYLADKLNATLALLGHSPHEGGTSASTHLSRLHNAFLPPPGGANWSAADVRELAIQAWALGALAGGSSAAASGLALHAATSGAAPGASALSSSLGLPSQPAGPVGNPSWEAFQPHTCLRLQNLGNAEGYNAVLLGPAPCSAATPGTAAVSGEAFRWGTSAAFMLDCSRRAGGDSSGSATYDEGEGAVAGSGSGGGGAFGSLAEAGKAAAKAAASSIAAAMDTLRTCRVVVSSGGDQGGIQGGGASTQLEYSFDRPLLMAPKLDALRLRICNLPPSTAQYPAALARGTTITLSRLKLNGRPLVAGPVAAPQAAASDGCLAQLYRLNSKATRSSFVLSGWLAVEQGTAGSGAAGGGGGAAGGFGVGEMASVELTLGEYSLLDAAASRLLSGGVSSAGGAPTP